MIDQIYIINLDDAVARRQCIEAQLTKLNVKKYTFFKAIRPSMDMLNNYPYFSINNSENIRRNELGCLLSHIGVMKDALHNNYKTIMVFEDDVHILDADFIQKTRTHIVSLENNFDILLLGANHKRPAKRKILDGIYECTTSNCTFAYCVQKKTMERLIIDYSYKFPIDIHWRKFDKVMPLNFYCIIPHLVNITDTISTIQNTQTNCSKIIFNSQHILLQGYDQLSIAITKTNNVIK